LLDGKSYETIPEELLVRAGLKAGISLLEPGTPAPSPAGSGSSCCGGGGCCY